MYQVYHRALLTMVPRNSMSKENSKTGPKLCFRPYFVYPWF